MTLILSDYYDEQLTYRMNARFKGDFDSGKLTKCMQVLQQLKMYNYTLILENEYGTTFMSELILKMRYVNKNLNEFDWAW